MRKILMLALLGAVAWFFGFADPAFKNEVYRFLHLSNQKTQQLAQRAGKPVAPTIVQQLYSPHVDETLKQ